MAKLITKMISKYPSERPTAAQVKQESIWSKYQHLNEIETQRAISPLIVNYSSRYDTKNIAMITITNNITLNATFFLDPNPYFDTFECAEYDVISKTEHLKEIRKIEENYIESVTKLANDSQMELVKKEREILQLEKQVLGMKMEKLKEELKWK